MSQNLDQSLEELTRFFTVRNLVKVLWVFVNSPAVWVVTVPIVEDVTIPLLRFLIHLAWVVAFDGLFLVILNNLEKRTNDPLSTKIIDIVFLVVWLAGAIAVALVNQEGTVGTVARISMGLFVGGIAIRESVAEELNRVRQEKLAATGKATPREARVQANHEFERFKIEQNALTQVARDVAEIEARAAVAERISAANIKARRAEVDEETTTRALAEIKEDATARRRSLELGKIYGNGPTAAHQEVKPDKNGDPEGHGTVKRGHDKHFAYCPVEGDIGQADGSPYKNDYSAVRRLKKHLETCPLAQGEDGQAEQAPAPKADRVEPTALKVKVPSETHEFRWSIIGTILGRGQDFSILDITDILEGHDLVADEDIQEVIEYGLQRKYCRETERQNIYRYQGSMSRELGI